MALLMRRGGLADHRAGQEGRAHALQLLLLQLALQLLLLQLRKLRPRRPLRGVYNRQEDEDESRRHARAARLASTAEVGAGSQGGKQRTPRGHPASSKGEGEAPCGGSPEPRSNRRGSPPDTRIHADTGYNATETVRLPGGYSPRCVGRCSVITPHVVLLSRTCFLDTRTGPLGASGRRGEPGSEAHSRVLAFPTPPKGLDEGLTPEKYGTQRDRTTVRHVHIEDVLADKAVRTSGHAPRVRDCSWLRGACPRMLVEVSK